MRGVLLVACLLLVLWSSDAFDIMSYAANQYSIVYSQFVNRSRQYYPSYGNPLEDQWVATTSTSGWTEGFFPGVLWNLCEYTRTLKACEIAVEVTEPTAPFANNTNTHDVGFVIMSGFGNGYRLLKNKDYLDVIVTGAHSLATRYSPIVRCTRSGNSKEGFIVIIDNMMNLEILFEAANQTNNQTLYNIGWQHANRTMYEHFRGDNSTYHVVEYNETDGSVVRKHTGQGKMRSSLEI
jgi:hypothetical protein